MTASKNPTGGKGDAAVRDSRRRTSIANNDDDDDENRAVIPKGLKQQQPHEQQQQRQEKQSSLSKRQRRKQPNEKNKWLIQHPKIHSMEARQKAYIKDAGLYPSKAEREQHQKTKYGTTADADADTTRETKSNVASKATRTAPPDVDPKLDLMSPEVKFGRLLGGTDQRKRHLAVRRLRAYLTARCDINNSGGGISELDLLKLWKALWYTLYMADKVPVQDELSKHLANLIWCLAGTDEEDEFAGQAYLEMTEDEEEDDNDENEMEIDEDDEDDGSNEADDYGDEDVTLTEVVNTLNDDEEDDNEDDEDDEDEEEDSEELECDHQDCDGNHGNDGDLDEVDDTELPHCRGAHLASLFVRTFFRTVRRDWGTMDKYRVDKFYTLIRLIIHEVYKYMALRRWNLGIIRLFNDAIFEEALSQRPNGLRYHLIDLSLEELARANSEAPIPLTEATLLDVLEPYLAMCQTGAKDETVQSRVMDRIVDRFLETHCVVSDNALNAIDDEEMQKEKDDKGANLIFNQVHVGTIAEFIFGLASDPETNDRYRKSLYDMHKKYIRRLKKIGKDVELDVDDGLIGNDDDDDDGHDVDEFVTDDMSEEAEVDIQQIKADTGTKRKSGSQGESDAKRKRNAGEAETSTDEIYARDKEVTEPKRKRKKKKKKKESSASAENDATEGANGKKLNEQHTKGGEDEEILISLAEQVKAKNHSGLEKKKKEQKSSRPLASSSTASNSNASDSAKKRVKFDEKVNRWKSHKASMKALITSTPPKTKDVTPEKSILRSKGPTKRSSTLLSKERRNKAVSYF